MTNDIKINRENIFKIIKKWLYSDKDIFIREIVSNSVDAISKLDKLAKQRGETLAQTALKWVLSKKGIVSVLVGASKPEQITDNIKALSGAYFSTEELKLIDDICNGK